MSFSPDNNNILIVEDDVAILSSMSEYFEISGYYTYKASCGEDAIEILKQKNIDVVITDIMMSGIDGLELTDIIKKNYNTDVIVMTGYIENYSYEEAINKGASDFVFKPIHFNELLLRLKRVLKERQLRQERNAMFEKLQILAITDGLTGLYNSRHFYQHIDKEINRVNRYHHPLSLLLLDIDYFKQYNDNYGHLEGDKLLVKMAKIIKSCLRNLDSAYRYGGEEFTILLPETSMPEAISVANRIRTAIENEKFNPKSDIIAAITVSVGVSQYKPQEELVNFIQRADQAMYNSKEMGRNQVSILTA